jgi:hypothetical protein
MTNSETSTPEAGYIYVITHTNRPGEVLVGKTQDPADLAIEFPAVDGWTVHQTFYFADVVAGHAEVRKRMRAHETEMAARRSH